jgi:hypothetical protein
MREPESECVLAMAGQIARSFRQRSQEAGSASRLRSLAPLNATPFAKVFAYASAQA